MCGAAASGAARIFLFRKFSNFFGKKRAAFLLFSHGFHRYLDIPHVQSGSISQNYTEIY